MCIQPIELDSLFVKRLQEELTEEQVAHVLEVFDGICNACWNADHGCQCWNDE